MALLAEEVVEEWLNRQGYFTIRGIKLGVHEIDILAFKPDTEGRHECRHIEVQVSTNPIGYISKVPKGMGPNSAKERRPEELEQGIAEWIAKKFDHPKKKALRERLFPGDWSRELVVNEVKYSKELDLFSEKGITIHHLKDIVGEMADPRRPILAAAGNDLFTLMQLGKQQAE